jgi:hypothetical protein
MDRAVVDENDCLNCMQWLHRDSVLVELVGACIEIWVWKGLIMIDISRSWQGIRRLRQAISLKLLCPDLTDLPDTTSTHHTHSQISMSVTPPEQESWMRTGA